MERLNIQMGNGQIIYDNKSLSLYLYSNQPNHNLSAIAPELLRHDQSHKSDLVFYPALLPVQEKPVEAKYVSRTNHIGSHTSV
jgi:hypothetical protein